MVFIGKWRLTQAAMSVRIDQATGILALGSGDAGGNDHFNAYGTATQFVLQGANGKYVVWTGSAYAATGTVDGAINQFTWLASGAAAGGMVDLGIDGSGADRCLWNAQGTSLTRTAYVTPPPPSATFALNIVTPGLAEILRGGFDSPMPDLIWVNLAQTDFTQALARLDFTTSLLNNADLSHCQFDYSTAFDGSQAPGVRFIGARLQLSSFGSVNCQGADFTDANLAGVQADNGDFTNATFTNAVLKQAGNLAHARFVNAKCQNADFSGTLNIYDTDFTGADLTGARFTGASVTGSMTIRGANLTDAALNNPSGVTIYPGKIILDATTNFTRCQLQNIDFSGYMLANNIFTGADMTGCSFHGATLTGAELAYAKLDTCKFTGTALLNGANLSNASAKGADFTNAQLGALSSLFSVADGSANYTILLDGLNTDNAAKVTQVFAANGYTLAGTVTITPSRFSDITWTVQATAPTTQSYTVIQQSIGGVMTLTVYSPTTPAVLSNAFMVNAIMTGANMIGVNAAGASIYGIGGSKPNLNAALLQDAAFNNANLSNADFSSADLGGVNFDYAILTNSVYQHARLTTSGTGTRASFVGANLQSANFDGAVINNVNFANAAVSLANPANGSLSAGVWLFTVPQPQAALITAELGAAASGQFTLTNQALQQLQTPGPVGPGIVNAFKQQGITLTADAVLSIMGEGIYWQLTDGTTHYVIFESYDPRAYAPALGVALGSQYTTSAQFYLPLSTEPYLKNGPVTPQVIAAFAAASHPISASAQVIIAQHPTDWQIINGAPAYQVYALWLAVVSNAGLTITVRPAIPNVISAFAAASTALSTRATVSKLSTNNGWYVSNDAQDPYNPVINYITFNLIQGQPNDPVDVYGAVMRIARLSGPDDLQYFNIAPGITVLAQSQLSGPGNVCPNGDFATTNQANGLPYTKWLRARVAPRPPRCIPDPNGMFFCPR